MVATTMRSEASQASMLSVSRSHHQGACGPSFKSGWFTRRSRSRLRYGPLRTTRGHAGSSIPWLLLYLNQRSLYAFRPSRGASTHGRARRCVVDQVSPSASHLGQSMVPGHTLRGRPRCPAGPLAAAGDDHGWAGLVERFDRMISAVARAHRLSDADAADVSQETWLRLLENIDDPARPALRRRLARHDRPASVPSRDPQHRPAVPCRR